MPLAWYRLLSTACLVPLQYRPLEHPTDETGASRTCGFPLSLHAGPVLLQLASEFVHNGINVII